jgi:hypothetical protein
MTSIKTKTMFIIILTFIIGMVAGALIDRALMQNQVKRFMGKRPPEMFVYHYERIIQPTDSQKKALRIILLKYAEKMAEIQIKMREKIFPLNEALKKELNPILTTEQLKRLSERFSRRGKGPFGRPGKRRNLRRIPDEA